MPAKRIAAGKQNLKALRDFVTALSEGDSQAADSALGRIKLKDTDFGKGYRKALSGMKISIDDGNVDSLMHKCLNGHLTKERRNELRREFSDRRKTPFAPKAERGYFAAWKDVLRLVDSIQKSKSG
jgi:hypothetical protein